MTNRLSKFDRPLDYDLTCWYINARRVMELVGTDVMTRKFGKISSIADIDDQLAKLASLAILKDAVTEWMSEANPPTLGQLLNQKALRQNSLFTHYTNYFFRGLPKVSEALRKKRPTIPMAEGYAKLDEFEPGLKLQFRFHHEHLTSNSAWVHLSGQQRLIVLGAVTNIGDGIIEAIPWVIANPIPGMFGPSTSPIGANWQSRLEVFVNSIDNFAAAHEIDPPRNRGALKQLQTIPENSIKAAFAEIIGEPTIPKDWGGERSDLFTTSVKVSGERISTAFAFKGPAKFHPMTVADLGKNGDQIDRLFSEPADLLILQHCHEITPPVRGMMRAYAQQMGHPRLFCLIDGYDTIKVLSAYAKCGFSKPAER